MSDPEVLEVKKRYYTRIMDVYRKKGIYIPCLPTLIRKALRLKVAKDRLKINTFYLASERGVREWFDTRHIFSVSGSSVRGLLFWPISSTRLSQIP